MIQAVGNRGDLAGGCGKTRDDVAPRAVADGQDVRRTTDGGGREAPDEQVADAPMFFWMWQRENVVQVDNHRASRPRRSDALDVEQIESMPSAKPGQNDGTLHQRIAEWHRDESDVGAGWKWRRVAAFDEDDKIILNLSGRSTYRR